MLQALPQCCYDCRGKNWKARYARQRKHTGATCGFVELRNALDELRSVREIQIVDATVDAMLNEPVGVRAVLLERPARVDNHRNVERSELLWIPAFAVEFDRYELGL